MSYASLCVLIEFFYTNFRINLYTVFDRWYVDIFVFKTLRNMTNSFIVYRKLENITESEVT